MSQLPLITESVATVLSSPSDEAARNYQRQKRAQRKRREKVLVAAHHMEKWTICLLLQEPNRAAQIYALHRRGDIVATDFFRPINRAIFEACMAAIGEHKAVMINGIKKHLQRAGLPLLNTNYLEGLAAVFIPPPLTVEHCLIALHERRKLNIQPESLDEAPVCLQATLPISGAHDGPAKDAAKDIPKMGNILAFPLQKAA